MRGSALTPRTPKSHPSHTEQAVRNPAREGDTAGKPEARSPKRRRPRVHRVRASHRRCQRRCRGVRHLTPDTGPAASTSRCDDSRTSPAISSRAGTGAPPDWPRDRARRPAPEVLGPGFLRPLLPTRVRSDGAPTAGFPRRRWGEAEDERGGLAEKVNRRTDRDFRIMNRVSQQPRPPKASPKDPVENAARRAEAERNTSCATRSGRPGSRRYWGS